MCLATVRQTDHDPPMAIPSEVPQRLVLYVDVLGFRALFNQAKSQDTPTTVWNDLVDSLQQWRLRTPQQGWATNDTVPQLAQGYRTIQTTMFSDSIIFSVEIENDDFYTPFFIACLAARMIAGFFAEYRSPIRGAMAYGQQLHDDQLILGSALIEAYELEASLARVPRILVADTLAHHLRFLSVPIVQNYLRQDSDGLWYYDSIRELMNPTQYYSDVSARKLFLMIAEGLKHADLSVQTKYRWMALRFNESLSHYAKTGSLAELVEIPL